jgi:acylphosphatase
MSKQVHVMISGKVQGVWFRASTKQQAKQFGVTGWVRNTSDGRVEAVFQGDDAKVDELLSWVHQGPPLAQVDNVQVNPQKLEETFAHFQVKR